MGYTLIPGVRQDHRGRHYQHGRYPNGKLIDVPVDPLPLSAKTLAELEPVEVHTERGTRYMSLRCFQGVSI